MNETNDRISVSEENDFGDYSMQNGKRDQSEESEESDQSIERPRRSNYGTGVDRQGMSFDEKRYVHGLHGQLLMMK